MKLLTNWREVLTHAWSIRLMILAGLLSGAEAGLPVFAEFVPIPTGVFGLLSAFTTACARGRGWWRRRTCRRPDVARSRLKTSAALAAAVAALLASRAHRDAMLLIMPADHRVDDAPAFLSAVEAREILHPQ